MLFALSLGACSQGGGPAAPKGWQPLAGAPSTWSSGSGAAAQEYRYLTTPFTGTLGDLASTVTIDVLLHHRGARLRGSVVPFAPCPGAAAVATFTLPDGSTLEAGFALRNEQAVRTTYTRPTGSPADPNVADAMQKSLCIAPA
jgi:hypothetical protein